MDGKGRQAALFLLTLLAGCLPMRSSPLHQTGTVAVRDGALEYEISGRGPAVVLIHGGLVDRRLWDAQVPALARDYRVIRYDLRGLGRSSRPTGPFSHLDDLRRLLDALEVERAVLVGLSLGGMIAMDYALEHPEQVRALVLAAPGLRGYTPSPSPQIQEVYRALATDPDRAVSLLLETGMGAVRPDAQEQLRRMFTENLYGWTRIDPASMRWPEPSTRERLSRIGAPTLILIGERDEQDLLAIADTLARRIPRAERVLLPDAKHHLNLDQPERFARHLREFLRGVGEMTEMR
jgi:3-oxoadipate enol-lactonase